MSSQPIVYAGPGLLRSGNTLSVNPNLRLQTLHVRDKLSCPEPLDASDAATRQFVLDSISKGGVVPGDGIDITTERKVSVKNDLVLKSLKLTSSELSDDGRNVITKGYVDAAVTPLVTKSYVDDNLKGLAKTSEITSAVEPLATRTYVTSFMDQFVSHENLSTAIQPFAKEQDVKNALNEKATTYYVDDAIKNLVKKTDLDNAVSSLASRDYVTQNVQNFPTRDEVRDKINSTADTVTQSLLSRITDAVTPLASKTYVDTALESKLSTSYVDKAIAPLATKSQLDKAISSLATESYVDTVTIDKVDKTYVQDELENLRNTIATYVDKTISTSSFPITYPIQHVQPSEGDTIESNGKTLLLINPNTSLSSLTLRFPSDSEDGKYLMVTAAKSIDSITYDNLKTLNNVTSDKFDVGTTRKWVYSTAVNAWLSI